MNWYELTLTVVWWDGDGVRINLVCVRAQPRWGNIRWGLALIYVLLKAVVMPDLMIVM